MAGKEVPFGMWSVGLLRVAGVKAGLQAVCSSENMGEAEG